MDPSGFSKVLSNEIQRLLKEDFAVSVGFKTTHVQSATIKTFDIVSALFIYLFICIIIKCKHLKMSHNNKTTVD